MTHRRPVTLPSAAELLVSGGDRRIALSDGRNRYGHPPQPRRGELAFSSSTASTVSHRGFAAAEALRARLEADLAHATPVELYGRETDRIRRVLSQHCGLAATPGVEIMLAASGTDLHLAAACLARAAAEAPLLVLSVQESETGSGLGDALSARHFGEAAVGGPVAKGRPIAIEGQIDVAAFAARRPDGALIDSAEVEADLTRRVRKAMGEGREVLLVATDLTKTGLIVPEPAALLRLKALWGSRLTVLVDACQFRITPSTLRAYLDQGFLVAVTGSKFLGGPAFSGALMVPPDLAARFAACGPPAGLSAYGFRDEWPRSWPSAQILSEGCNFGLLMRWEAALCELAALAVLNPRGVRQRAERFAEAVQASLKASPWLAPLESRPLDRGAADRAEAWDAVATIFPFRVRQAEGRFLGVEALTALNRQLAAGQDGRPVIRLGQPVACGQGVGALRLCFSARHAVETEDATAFAALLDSVETVVTEVEALAAQSLSLARGAANRSA